MGGGFPFTRSNRLAILGSQHIKTCVEPYQHLLTREKKLRAYDSCTELGSASAYLWRNLSSRSTTSLLAARAVGFVAAESLTKIRVQTFKAAHPGTPRSVVPPQSWGDRSDTKHSKCLLLGGRRLNQLTLIPKPKGSGGAQAATAQVGPAIKEMTQRDAYRLKRRLDLGKPSPGKPQSAQQSQHKCSVLPLDLKCPEVTSRIAFIAIVTSSTFER